MDRIIIHWTAGGNTANGSDLEHYHRLVQGDGSVVAGRYPISANARPLNASAYAAHTRNLNTGSIAIAVCGMHGARQFPFSAGRWPITDRQVDALAVEVARVAKEYGIPVTRSTILTHAEVQPTLKVAQAGKWDICWLPGMAASGDPIVVGDEIRRRVSAALAGSASPAPSQPAPAPAPPKLTVNSAVVGLAVALAAAAVFLVTR